MDSISKCIFIGGCSRSGTTFLGSILGGAEGAVTTPESQFKSDIRRSVARGELPGTADAILTAIGEHWRFRLWGSELPSAEALRTPTVEEATLAVVKAYAEARTQSAPRCWIDHSPDNIRDASWLLTSFPDARIVHLVRDGRGVAASLMRMDVGPNTVMAAAKLWVHSVGIGLAMESAFPDRVMRVTYESLLRQPEETVRAICSFTGLSYSPNLLEGGEFSVPAYTRSQHRLVGKPPDASVAERWREALAPRDIELFEFVAGPMLDALGYDLVYDGHPRPATYRERILGLYRDLLWGRIRSRVLNWQRRRQAGL